MIVVVELGIEVGSEHETCTVSFQQCDQCQEILSQEQESSLGSRGWRPLKTGLIISLVLGTVTREVPSKSQ